MDIKIKGVPSRDGLKIWHTFEWGKGADQRKATGIFTYTHCKTPEKKNYNKEALILLEIKRAQLILEQQSIGTGYIPAHKFKHNFLDFYQEYVDNNKTDGNRHLSPGQSYPVYKIRQKK